jgi:hypothetical protein
MSNWREKRGNIPLMVCGMAAILLVALWLIFKIVR